MSQQKHNKFSSLILTFFRTEHNRFMPLLIIKHFTAGAGGGALSIVSKSQQKCYLLAKSQQKPAFVGTGYLTYLSFAADFFSSPASTGGLKELFDGSPHMTGQGQGSGDERKKNS
jgi:hypothetical protein